MKRFMSVIAAVLLLSCVVMGSVEPVLADGISETVTAAFEAPIANGSYQITSSGYTLNTFSGEDKSYPWSVLAAPPDGSTEQIYTVTRQQDNSYQLVDHHFNRYVSPRDGIKYNSYLISTPTNVCNWVFTSRGNGKYSISPSSNLNLVFTITGTYYYGHIIMTLRPYEGIEQQLFKFQQVGGAVSSVRQKMDQIKNTVGYTEGTTWDQSRTYKNLAWGCVAFAREVGEIISGKDPVTGWSSTTYSGTQRINFDSISVGDYLSYDCSNGNTHTFLVYEKGVDYILAAEGGYIPNPNNSGYQIVHWGRRIAKSSIQVGASISDGTITQLRHRKCPGVV